MPYPRTPVVASPADLAWLAGEWSGRFGDDAVEEYWSSPSHETIVGCFRWFSGSVCRFYEIIAIERWEEGVVMLIKHFDPGLVGWEERETAMVFDLVRLDAGEAVFLKRGSDPPLWLVYRKPVHDEMIVCFAGPDGDAPTERTFHYRRARTNSVDPLRTL